MNKFDKRLPARPRSGNSTAAGTAWAALQHRVHNAHVRVRFAVRREEPVVPCASVVNTQQPVHV